MKISPEKTMDIAEELYRKGIISYPRTETNSFDDSMDLLALVSLQTESSSWGNYARDLIAGQYLSPKKGRNNDHAHPPIHPTAFVSNLTGKHKDLYEFITRHFLAACSKDAIGDETVVTIQISEQTFKTTGLVILEENWLKGGLFFFFFPFFL